MRGAVFLAFEADAAALGAACLAVFELLGAFEADGATFEALLRVNGDVVFCPEAADGCLGAIMRIAIRVRGTDNEIGG